MTDGTAEIVGSFSPYFFEDATIVIAKLFIAEIVANTKDNAISK